MARKHISQATARAWQKRLCELERKIIDLNGRGMREYHGTHLTDATVTNADWWIVRTATRCGRAVIARAKENSGAREISLHAMDV